MYYRVELIIAVTVIYDALPLVSNDEKLNECYAEPGVCIVSSFVVKNLVFMIDLYMEEHHFHIKKSMHMDDNRNNELLF